MAFDPKLIKKILVIAGAVVLVLIVGVFFSPEADLPLADKNKNSQVFVSSAEIRGASDESIIQGDLEIDEADDNKYNNQGEKINFSNQKNGFYKVVKVIDGDTIVVDIGGKNETVRLIGIDAPEIGGGSSKQKCFGKESEELAKKILSGVSVYLETDASQNDRDKYNRLLRYAIMENGNNFNKQMISSGLAREYTYKTPYKYQKEFKNAENEARNAKKGLWSACYDNTNNHISSGGENRNSGNLLNSAQILKSGDCYCESNKYNCPDFKTHLEAQKVFECCVAKVGKDIHKLDGNNDGQVCESLP